MTDPLIVDNSPDDPTRVDVHAFIGATSVHFEYNTQSSIANSVRIGDDLTAFIFTLDEAHEFHAHLTDFLARSRQAGQRPLPVEHAGLQPNLEPAP